MGKLTKESKVNSVVLFIGAQAYRVTPALRTCWWLMLPAVNTQLHVLRYLSNDAQSTSTTQQEIHVCGDNILRVEFCER